MENTVAESQRKGGAEVSKLAHNSATASTPHAMVIQLDSSCTGIARVTKVSAVPTVTSSMGRSDARRASSARAIAA